jgi:small subunit ribosomal protein S6
MVEITIIIEGGVEPSGKNTDVALDNSESLRYSFNRIFSELLGTDVSIIIRLQGNYSSAYKVFKEDDNANVFLFVDYDSEKDTNDRLKKISEEMQKRIFFMKPEMEEWILQQPEAIELWGKKNKYDRISTNTDITTIIRQRDSLIKPSVFLKQIIPLLFAKAKYRKLRTASELIDCLDAQKLREADSEIKRFYLYVHDNFIVIKNDKNDYETVFILTPQLSEIETQEVVDRFVDYLISEGAEIVNKENWGLRSLAYPIQKKSTGIYSLIEFKAKPQVIAKLETQFRRNERVMRFLTFKQDKNFKAYAAKRRETRKP